MHPLMAPSILAADHARLGEEIRAVQQAGADWLHVDVMDGHFVPNLTLGPPIIKALRRVTEMPFDVHLMISNPQSCIADYVDAGANLVTVHAEACTHLHRVLMQIREAGVQVGVSINPATPVAAVEHVLHLVDLVLVMSVNPGFGGQSFIPEVLTKVAQLHALRQQLPHPYRISIDGGITPKTIGAAARAGADIFVAGSAVFGTADYADAISALRRAAA
jgi:ribulose-phosphate 3-epimerase